MRASEAEDKLGAMLEEAGLDPAHLDTWEAWKVFKLFARVPVEADGEGLAVQATGETTPDGLERVYLSFVRQFTAIEGEESAPIRFAGLELIFDWAEHQLDQDLDIWSYDFPTIQAFVASVEESPAFQRAAALRVLESSVVGGEA